jgi:hypothetical protein
MYEDVTVYDFERAWFRKDFSKLSKEDFDVTYSEYIDATGWFATEEFDLVSNINYLAHRLTAIETAISVHAMFLFEFDKPYEDFSVFQRWGYSIKWTGDKDKFINDLQLIISGEASTKTELLRTKNELVKKRQQYNKGDKTIKQSHEEFVQMINSLNKIGFNILKKETTVQELSIMIKQQLEENESYTRNTQSYRR